MILVVIFFLVIIVAMYTLHYRPVDRKYRQSSGHKMADIMKRRQDALIYLAGGEEFNEDFYSESIESPNLVISDVE